MFTASVFVGQLYVVGGLNAERHTLSSVERFNPELGVWQTLALMSTERSEHTASVIAGQLYIVGGFDDEYQGLSSCLLSPSDAADDLPRLAYGGRGRLRL